MSRILVLGGSGLTGGPLLSRVATDYTNSTITVALRTHILDDAIKSLGPNFAIEHVDFDSNTTRVSELVADNDITLDLANSRSPELARAVITGAAGYTKKHNRRPLLLHLSGAGNFSDNSHTGAFVDNPNPFNDANTEQVKAIDASYLPNGAADQLILSAAAEGLLNSYIVCPVGIYGISKHHVALKSDSPEATRYAGALGVWSQWMLDSIQSHGFSPYIGPGTALFNVVHVDDVVDLIMLVLHEAVEIGQEYAGDDAYRHFYLASSETLEAKTIAEVFAKAAHRMGIIERAEVRSLRFDAEDGGDGDALAAKTAAYRYLAGNILLKLHNAARLGWEPKGPTLQEAMDAL